VLGDPVDRAVRHWRAMNAALSRSTVGPRGVDRAAHMAAYTNGTTLSRKVRTEATQLGECLHTRSARGEQLVSAWQECTSRACNWAECIIGTGLYAPQLRHFLNYFPRERFLLLEEEMLTSQPQLVASTLSHFLELPRPLHSDAVRAAASNRSHSAVVGDALRRALRTFYAAHVPYVRALFEQLAPAGAAWSNAAWLNT